MVEPTAKEARMANQIRILQNALTRRKATITSLEEALKRARLATHAEAKAEAWGEGERHESEYLMTVGQFCPNGDKCNPYREGAKRD